MFISLIPLFINLHKPSGELFILPLLLAANKFHKILLVVISLTWKSFKEYCWFYWDLHFRRLHGNFCLLVIDLIDYGVVFGLDVRLYHTGSKKKKLFGLLFSINNIENSNPNNDATIR